MDSSRINKIQITLMDKFLYMPTGKQWIYYGLDATIRSDIDPKSLATQGFRYAQTILVF